VLKAVQQVLEEDPRVTYAMLFGSSARGSMRPDSDIDVAVGLAEGRQLGSLDLGALTSKLEAATGRRVDVIVMDEAAPGLAYRIFRDGRVLVERDRRALVARRARAVLEYLDFQPVEELCARGVLDAAARGR